MYGVILKDNEIKKINTLEEFKKASFPVNVSNEELKTFGILPLKNEPLEDWEKFGAFLEYKIFDNYILEKKEKENIDLEVYKKVKIELLKGICKNTILNKYSITTQRNILINKDEEQNLFIEMKEFIADKRQTFSNQIKTINSLSSHQDIFNYYAEQITAKVIPLGEDFDTFGL